MIVFAEPVHSFQGEQPLQLRLPFLLRAGDKSTLLPPFICYHLFHSLQTPLRISPRSPCAWAQPISWWNPESRTNVEEGASDHEPICGFLSFRSSTPQKRQLPCGQLSQERRTGCASSWPTPYQFHDIISENVCFSCSKCKHVLFRHASFKQVKSTLQSVCWPKTLIGLQNRYANRTIIQIYGSCPLL